MSKSKCAKHQLRSTFGSWDVEKVHAVVVRSTFRSQHVKSTTCLHHLGPLLDVQMSFRVSGARDSTASQKGSKTWGFCSSFKNISRRWTLEEDLPRCMSRGMRNTRDMFIRDVRRSGRWFPERACILEHQIFRFAKMILRDRCSISYDLASLFSWQAQYFRQMEWKNRKRHCYEAVSSALKFPFLKEVSQKLLRFWCCQLRTLRKSRSIASFFDVVELKIEEVLQNCCVFDVVKFKNWGSLAA